MMYGRMVMLKSGGERLCFNCCVVYLMIVLYWPSKNRLSGQELQKREGVDCFHKRIEGFDDYQ